jgi:hypothetical protein
MQHIGDADAAPVEVAVVVQRARRALDNLPPEGLEFKVHVGGGTADRV